MATATATGRTAPSNDIEMYYELRGEGPPLVLLSKAPGRAATGLVFDLAELGSGHGHRPDLRGRPLDQPSGLLTIPSVRLRRLRPLDHLGEGVPGHRPQRRRCLLHLATQQPDRVESMVLVSTVLRAGQGDRAPRLRRGAARREEWRDAKAATRRRRADPSAVESAAPRAASHDDMSFTPVHDHHGAHDDRERRPRSSTRPRSPWRCTALHPALLPVDLPNGGHGPIFGEWKGPFARAALAFLRGDPGEQAVIEPDGETLAPRGILRALGALLHRRLRAELRQPDAPASSSLRLHIDHQRLGRMPGADSTNRCPSPPWASILVRLPFQSFPSTKTLAGGSTQSTTVAVACRDRPRPRRSAPVAR